MLLAAEVKSGRTLSEKSFAKWIQEQEENSRPVGHSKPLGRTRRGEVPTERRMHGDMPTGAIAGCAVRSAATDEHAYLDCDWPTTKLSFVDLKA